MYVFDIIFFFVDCRESGRSEKAYKFVSWKEQNFKNTEFGLFGELRSIKYTGMWIER